MVQIYRFLILLSCFTAILQCVFDKIKFVMQVYAFNSIFCHSTGYSDKRKLFYSKQNETNLGDKGNYPVVALTGYCTPNNRLVQFVIFTKKQLFILYFSDEESRKTPMRETSDTSLICNSTTKWVDIKNNTFLQTKRYSPLPLYV